MRFRNYFILPLLLLPAGLAGADAWNIKLGNTPGNTVLYQAEGNLIWKFIEETPQSPMPPVLFRAEGALSTFSSGNLVTYSFDLELDLNVGLDPGLHTGHNAYPTFWNFGVLDSSPTPRNVFVLGSVAQVYSSWLTWRNPNGTVFRLTPLKFGVRKVEVTINPTSGTACVWYDHVPVGFDLPLLSPATLSGGMKPFFSGKYQTAQTVSKTYTTASGSTTRPYKQHPSEPAYSVSNFCTIAAPPPPGAATGVQPSFRTFTVGSTTITVNARTGAVASFQWNGETWIKRGDDVYVFEPTDATLPASWGAESDDVATSIGQSQTGIVVYGVNSKTHLDFAKSYSIDVSGRLVKRMRFKGSSYNLKGLVSHRARVYFDAANEPKAGGLVTEPITSTNVVPDSYFMDYNSRSKNLLLSTPLFIHKQDSMKGIEVYRNQINEQQALKGDTGVTYAITGLIYENGRPSGWELRIVSDFIDSAIGKEITDAYVIHPFSNGALKHTQDNRQRTSIPGIPWMNKFLCDMGVEPSNTTASGLSQFEFLSVCWGVSGQAWGDWFLNDLDNPLLKQYGSTYTMAPFAGNLHVGTYSNSLFDEYSYAFCGRKQDTDLPNTTTIDSNYVMNDREGPISGRIRSDYKYIKGWPISEGNPDNGGGPYIVKYSATYVPKLYSGPFITQWFSLLRSRQDGTDCPYKVTKFLEMGGSVPKSIFYLDSPGAFYETQDWRDQKAINSNDWVTYFKNLEVKVLNDTPSSRSRAILTNGFFPTFGDMGYLEVLEDRWKVLSQSMFQDQDPKVLSEWRYQAREFILRKVMEPSGYVNILLNGMTVSPRVALSYAMNYGWSVQTATPTTYFKGLHGALEFRGAKLVPQVSTFWGEWSGDVTVETTVMEKNLTPSSGRTRIVNLIRHSTQDQALTGFANEAIKQSDSSQPISNPMILRLDIVPGADDAAEAPFGLTQRLVTAAEPGGALTTPFTSFLISDVWALVTHANGVDFTTGITNSYAVTLQPLAFGSTNKPSSYSVVKNADGPVTIFFPGASSVTDPGGQVHSSSTSGPGQTGQGISLELGNGGIVSVTY